MARILGLHCRECGEIYDISPVHVCELCFGPLEIQYNYDEIGQTFSRQTILDGPLTMWRYAQLLPLNGEPCVGRQVGYTPLVKADNLASKLGVKEVYIKNDAVSHPTLSFKDRVVAVELSKATRRNPAVEKPHGWDIQ